MKRRGPTPLEKAKLWRERLRLFERSGLSVAEFCRQQKLSVRSFYHWLRRLGDQFRLHDLDSINLLAASIVRTDIEDLQSLQPLCEAMLDRKREAVNAIGRFRESVRAFRRRIRQCRDHLRWTEGAETDGLSIEEVARVWGTDPDFVRKLVLKALPAGNHAKILLGLPGRWCPLCRRGSVEEVIDDLKNREREKEE